MPDTKKPDAKWDTAILAPSEKGFLSDYTDPNNRLVFQYNPPEIEEEKEINWVGINIPGSDNELVQFGSGQSLRLNIQLFFNQYGEQPNVEGVPNVYQNSDYNYVETALQWLHSFTETRQSDDPVERFSPGILLFGFGQSIFGAGSGYDSTAAGTPSMMVRIASMTTTRMLFDKTTMKPRRAMVELTLARHALFPR